MNLVLLGAPGAGKGTQADVIRQKTGMYILSTGNLLREAVKAGTELGGRVKELLDGGSLVPDQLIIELVQAKLCDRECAAGVIFDGFPRTLNQARELDGFAKIEKAVLFDVPDEVITERMSLRRICRGCQASYHLKTLPPKQEGRCDKCGEDLFIRKDDDPEVVARRLEVYHRETEPIIDYYRASGRLASVDGTQAPEKVSVDALAVVETR